MVTEGSNITLFEPSSAPLKIYLFKPVRETLPVTSGAGAAGAAGAAAAAGAASATGAGVAAGAGSSAYTLITRHTAKIAVSNAIMRFISKVPH
jgi:hypothetical protein